MHVVRVGASNQPVCKESRAISNDAATADWGVDVKDSCNVGRSISNGHRKGFHSKNV